MAMAITTVGGGSDDNEGVAPDVKGGGAEAIGMDSDNED